MLLRGYAALQEGRADEAVAAFREAAAGPAAQPFARYALACLGQDDRAAVLASQPGLFVALRCRAWAALDRFRTRQATPAELLDAVQQAASAGWKNPAADHFRRLALALQMRQTTADDVRSLTTDQTVDPAARRNLLRVALELAVRRLPTPTALELLLEWSGSDGWADDLRALLCQQLLRLLLLRQAAPVSPLSPEPGTRVEEPSDDVILAAVDRLAPGDGRTALVRTWLQPAAPVSPLSADADALPAVRLWQAARALAEGAMVDDSWREELRGLRSQARWKGPAQALLLLEAAQRGDAEAVGTLLDETDFWRGFRPAPPRFVVEAVAAVVAAQPNHPGWRRCLGRWVQVWGAAALGPIGRDSIRPGWLVSAPGRSGRTAAGDAARAWFLHQAARALGRDEAEALTYVRRATTERSRADDRGRRRRGARRAARVGAPGPRLRPGRRRPAGRRCTHRARRPARRSGGPDRCPAERPRTAGRGHRGRPSRRPLRSKRPD